MIENQNVTEGKGIFEDQGVLNISPEIKIEWQCKGRFLSLKHGDHEIKFEARPEFDSKGDVKFNLYIISPPELTATLMGLSELKETKQIAEAFGFRTMIWSSGEIYFFGKKVLRITCKAEKILKLTEGGGYFIVYQPRFILRI
jgi:hypothetical protein